MIAVTPVSDFAPPAPLHLVLIAHDRLLLETLPDDQGPWLGLQIAGRAVDVVDGRDLIQRSVPELVLLDGPSFAVGFRTLFECAAIRIGQSRTAVFADDLSDTQLEIALGSGVTGLLSRQDSLSELAAALRTVASGGTFVSSSLHERVAPDTRGGHRVLRRTRLERFSNRQLEVLIHLADGKRVKDIADAMHLSEKAIESHKYRLMNRLGIHDRVQLCRWAIREGLIRA